MQHLTTNKTAFGLITRRLNDPRPILRFLHNARQHEHRIDRAIIAYSHQVSEKAVAALRREIRTDVVRAPGDPVLRDRLLGAGLTPDEVDGLLDVPSWPCYNEVPYGSYRNAVLLRALLGRVDYLLFFDTDIQPRVLTSCADGRATWADADFVGGHLDHLAPPDVVATSSNYSGYDIVPPLGFDGLEDLLVGLRKEAALDYLVDCDKHGCLNLGPQRPGQPVPTNKVLGGNLGLSLDAPWKLVPFFSATYAIDDRCVLGRGEDTLLGQATYTTMGLALDVDLHVFHDTYDDFPRAPDIKRKAIRNRFYRACLGWIGRNPFLTWYLDQIGRLETDFETAIERQREGLRIGAPKAARHLEDVRFKNLPAALGASLATLPEMIERYERLMVGWTALVEVLHPETVRDVSPDERGGPVSMVA